MCVCLGMMDAKGRAQSEILQRSFTPTACAHGASHLLRLGPPQPPNPLHQSPRQQQAAAQASIYDALPILGLHRSERIDPSICTSNRYR